MSDQNAVSGEQYPHKITAEYASQSEADSAARSLLADADQQDQVKNTIDHSAQTL